MIRRINLRGQRFTRTGYRREIPRAQMDIEQALKSIQPILDRVKNGVEKTLLDLTEEFDGVRPDSLKVSHDDIQGALNSLSPQVRLALEESISRVRAVHENQKRQEIRTDVVKDGIVIHKQIPVERVGLYVPGGKAVYPSSVVMNVVPAQVAGVNSIAIASPAQKNFDGLPHPTILATCALLGISEVYSIGGAQAIAMFAYGVEGLCEGVDVVTGPGNIYVAAAKRALRGLIGIDSEAGPTEIAILADDSARAADVAADLMSQAEHDTIAAAVLVTPSEKLLQEVEVELTRRVPLTKHSDRISTALRGIQSALVLVDSMEHGIDVVNAYAAEHLEIIATNAREISTKIKNAGAVFIGRFSPVSLGDYSAGSNHVLPTGGCACHSSGLSVQTFLKGVSFIDYSEQAFNDIAESVITLANAEDLPAHGEAIKARFE